ncbi:MAG TPA: LysR family transcriptional regulator [Myxococcaceae bacterium]|nr:LysR family transcriptional regulator [Myxococcaceae bacterium]
MVCDEPCASSPPGNKLPDPGDFVSKTPATDVDLNRIAVFLRVVELQSFTAAAETLGLPKSSVSRSVARLEESLGVQLLQRTTRTIQLTEAGRLYFEQASRALSELEQAHETLSQLDARPQGPVRITAPADLGALVLAQLAARFVRRTPGITLEFILTGRVVNLVEEGVDLAVRAGPLRDSSLISRRVNGLDGWLFASPAYLDARGTPTSLQDLAAHDCVLFRPRRGETQWTLAGPGGKTQLTVRGPVAADDFIFLREAVLAGAGIGLLPALQCEQDLARGRLVRLLAPYTGPSAPLHVVWPASRHVPKRVLLVREWLVKSLGEIAPTSAERDG